MATTACPDIAAGGPSGIADALAAVDCRASESVAAAFSRLFGEGGALLPALTILLTLYVAWLAIGLMTGRTRLGVSALTPRMLGIGLALTFATSWMAYQSTVWTLATGAPDEIAGALMGTRGSATAAFAERLDIVFGAIAEAAEAAEEAPPPPAEGAAAAPAAATTATARPISGSFTAIDLMWMGALMLLLGTAGVLLTAKIALAALLALGPVFIVMALFAGTKGLFEGWLKGLVMFALVPLLAVLVGGGMVELIVPIIQGMVAPDGTIEPRAAVTLFLAAAVYLALMVMVVKTAAMLVAGWRVPFGRDRAPDTAPAAPASATASATSSNAQTQLANDRVQAIVGALPAPAGSGGGSGGGGMSDRTSAVIRQIATASQPATALPAPLTPMRDPRLAGVGSRFRPVQTVLPKEKIA